MTDRSETIALVLPDGRRFTLRPDVNALCEYERFLRAAGLDPLIELERIPEPGGAPFTVMRALLAAFCHEQHPEMTLAEAGRVLSAYPDLAGSAVGAGIRVAMPAKAASAEAEADAPAEKPSP